MFWNLMPKENISQSEREALSKFILTNDKYTQGVLVEEFEKEWSNWQGCKYSVFVNSGSSANLLLVKSLLDLYGPGGFISQACTWPTNANPAIQLKGSQFLQLCDNNLSNFGFDISLLKCFIRTNKPKYIFLTHILGFNGASQELIDICKENKIILIEDCCESHGASFNGTKVGNIGLAGTFSFYYGHHMTTIEGGMISTNDENLFIQLRLNRSHGFLREHPHKEQIQLSDVLDKRFAFLTDGFNFRNTEINAFLGLMQIKKLNDNIQIRNQNYSKFITELDSTKYYADFNSSGLSSFALPIITKQNNIDLLKNNLTSVGIENRPFIAGNLFNQPYMKKVNMFQDFKNADILHSCGMYVGNNQFVDHTMVSKLLDVLNNA